MRNFFTKKKVFCGLMLSLIAAVTLPSVVFAEGTPLVMDYNGSTTVGPIVVQATNDFNTHPPVSGMTMGTIAQTGSNEGWVALQDDDCNIANSSSTIKSAADAWADAYAIARDGIMVIVTNEVSEDVTSLTKAQIEYIYERGSLITNTTWNDVDLVDDNDDWDDDSDFVIARARETTSGTRDTICSLCSIDKDTLEPNTINALQPTYPRFASNAAFQDGMETSTVAAIGYVGMGFGPDDSHTNIRAVPIVNPTNGVAYQPTEINIYGGYYPLSRFLFMGIHDNDSGTTPNADPNNYANELKAIQWFQELDGYGQKAAVDKGFLRLVPDADIIVDEANTVDISDLIELGTYWYDSVTDRSVTRADITRDNFVDLDDLGEIGLWWFKPITAY